MAVNQGLAGTGAIVANSGAGAADTAGLVMQNMAPGAGAATNAGVQGQWGNLVAGSTQSIGGAVSAVDPNVGQPIANYGTAVGNGVQVGLTDQSWANGVTTGLNDANFIA